MGGEGWDELAEGRDVREEEGRDVREEEGRGMMTTCSLLSGVLVDNVGRMHCQWGCCSIRLSPPLQGPFL